MTRLKRLPSEVTPRPVFHELDRDGEPPFGLALHVPENFSGIIREEILRVFSKPEKDSLLRGMVEDHGFLLLQNILLQEEEVSALANIGGLLENRSFKIPSRGTIIPKNASFSYFLQDSSHASAPIHISEGKRSYEHIWEPSQTLLILGNDTSISGRLKQHSGRKKAIGKE